MSTSPQKLKKDSIAEAICEVRFECQESASIPEILVGKLTDFEDWKSFQKIRLSVMDIPAPIRALNPDLRRQPVMELREEGGPKIVKIGANVLSLHRKAPYAGWERFRPEIYRFVEFLFGSFQDFRCTRLGIRYINIFTREDHGVESVKDLNYQVTLDGKELTSPQNINYQILKHDNHNILVRVASPEFVSGTQKDICSALVDLDVFTPDDWRGGDRDDAEKWIEDAHTYEKYEFFKLFTPKMKSLLVEEQ